MDVNTRRNEFPPSERFLRRRVAPRQSIKRGLRGPLRAVAAGAGVAGLALVGFWTAAAAGSARQLSVSRILVEGNQRLSEGEILESLGLHQGANILALDLPALKEKILRSSWVKDAELTRVLPATLNLNIVERTPVGIAVLDRLYLMDEEGVLLDELGPLQGERPLPLVRGVAREGTLDSDRSRVAGRVLARLRQRPRLEEAVSEIDLSGGASHIRVVLRSPPLSAACEEASLVERLSEFVPLASDIERRFPGIEEIDLRFRGRMYLRPRQGMLAVMPVERSTQGGEPH